jgi:molybdopterin-containing oxidoreductase family iron-sulfur binding subunit
MTAQPLSQEPAPAPPTGKTYWRSLDELADAPAFRQWVEEVFPRSMRELLDGGIDRRRFLLLMGASLGLAGLAGCRRPELKALPYTKPPEGVVPGLPNYYATAMPRAGTAFPVVVESHEGRPTKVEGNPRHPDSGGASDAQAQASVLDLYDPDRSSGVLHEGRPSNWLEFDSYSDRHFAAVRERKGQGLHFLSEDFASPSLDLLREHVHTVIPEARWHVFEPISTGNIQAGAQIAFGEPLALRYRFDRARVVLALDCDFLGLEEDGVRHLRGFAQARLAQEAGVRMNRLYAVESQYTLTGGMADHRLRLPASHVGDYTLLLARELLQSDPVVPPPGSPQAALREALASFRPSVAFEPRWVREVAADLRAHAGKGLIIAGRRQPALVHALAHALNSALGNLGETIELHKRPTGPDAATLSDLAHAIEQGRVQTLVLLGGNPAYSAPVDINFAALMARVEHTIRLGAHVDETSQHARWHLPAAHYLESWGDARTGDGTLVPIQPLIEPLFDGRTVLELVARLIRFETTKPYEIVRRAFRRVSKASEAGFEVAWREFLHAGMLAGSGYPLASPSLRWGAVAGAVKGPIPAPRPLSADAFELVFDRDSKVGDGRFANNAWLQEAPDAITKLAWDNAAIVSPRSAGELGLESGDMIRLEWDGRSLEIPALWAPGQADYSVSLALGYGRTAAGRVGQGVGFNAFRLRTSAAPDIATGLRVTRVGGKHLLACTAHHFTMEGRDLVRESTAALARGSEAFARPAEEHRDIHTRPELMGEHQWGMAIDLNTCIGCNACVVACQAENNIPVVGKDEVLRGREMHWIRIDRYFSGVEGNPELVHQPVTCMHCESAPCEVVCPVNATVHSDEGLNVMVYSRCIGTRYCMNNCPYKVRRFNFFNYNERPLDELWKGPLAPEGLAETLKMQKNPDVTVRMRGVMEKCTYCVQRIERGKIAARVAAGASGPAPIPDGTIVPACAQACPAQAIVFGDLADPASKVSQLKNQLRNYELLGELNTRPRTSYLARLRNPNPKMGTAAPSVSGGRA